jgi:hypothetical protein
LILEITVTGTLYLLYRAGRLLVRDHSAVALANADSVVDFERALQLDSELGLQHLVLDHHWVVMALNQYYVHAHFVSTAVVLVAIYGWRREYFARVRTVIVLVTLCGLVLHLAYPLAPPRMLPGFVDTVNTFGPGYYNRSDVASVANQYAAMPSLHLGWSVIVAWSIVESCRSTWRWLAVIHPTATLLAITATANHYWLDSLVALALVVAAVAFTRTPLVDRIRRVRQLLTPGGETGREAPSDTAMPRPLG